MSRLYVTMTADGAENDLTYNWGNLGLVLSLDKSLLASDSFSFYLYNDQLMLLGDAKSGEPEVERANRSLRVKFARPHIWLPGHYFLLVRLGSGQILRYDLTLDEHRCFEVAKPVTCGKQSLEDILSGRLCYHRNQWRELSQVGGLQQWKNWLIQRARYLELNEYRVDFGINEMRFCNNMLFSFFKASGKEFFIDLFKDVSGIEGTLKGAYCSDFYDATQMNPYESLGAFFQGTSAIAQNPFATWENEPYRVYCFYQPNHLSGASGKIIASRIRCHWPAPKTSAFFCGTKQDISTMLEENPSWQIYFPQENRLSEEPYACEEIIHTFFKIAHCSSLFLNPEAADKMCRLLKEAYSLGTISHWGFKDIRDYVHTQLLRDYCKHAVSAIQGGRPEALHFEVRPEDIDEQVLLSRTSTYSDVLNELNTMVGLDDIKQSIATLSNRMKFYTTRRQLGLSTTDGTTYHAIFTGNPGTGKTTVARMLGKIYHSLGLLSKGEVICVDRKKIIGRYIGDTEDNMKAILREARGNVLFVDEAYTLYSEEGDRDFGRRAVDCLLDILAQKEPDMLVIFAGYKREMDKLMSMNPGLVGRFPYKFHFSDYDSAQLQQIAETILSKDQYLLTPEAKAVLTESIDDTVAHHSESFANARWVEQFVRNGIIPALADRVSASLMPVTTEAYQRIEASDVTAAYEKFNPRVIELKPRRKVGFSA